MICKHCGKALENESQLFCAFCGYPVGEVKRGFFARTEETGEFPADESAPMSQPAQPVPQPVMPQAAQMSMPMGGMMGMMPQMSMMQGMMPYMGMMPNLMNQMSVMQGQQQIPNSAAVSEQSETPQTNQQQMFQNPMMMGVAGMSQMMGYDTNGNPIYIQMMPQVMGYDPYGNPIYAMVPVQCAMPPQMQNLSSQQEESTETVQESPKPVSAQGRAISQPIAKKKLSVPQMPKEQPEPESAEPLQENPPVQDEEKQEEQTPSIPEKPRVANAHGIGQPIQQGFFARQVKLQNPVANGVGIKPAEKVRPEPTPVPPQDDPEPAEEIPVSADLLMMDEDGLPENLPDEKELLDSIFSDQPKKYTMSEGAEPSAKTFSISLSASEVTTVRRRKSGIVPDTLEKVPQPPSQEEQLFSKVEKDLPPPMAMYDKPPQKDPNSYSRSRSRHQPFQPQNNTSQYQQAQSYSQQQGTNSQYQQAQPYPQQGTNSQYQQAQPYPQQGNSYQSQPYPQSYPQQGNQYPSQPYPQQSNSYQYQQSQSYPQQGNGQPYQQPYQSQYFQGQVSAKQPEIPEPQEKILPSKVERPMPKFEKPRHKSTNEKGPAKIVDPTEFFGEQKVKSRGDLGVTAVDNMSDEQLAAQLARMQFGGKKKSRRSMKAATELEADYSNIPADMLPSDT